MVILITLWSFFVKIGSFILILVGITGFIVAVIFTAEHADIIAKSEKPQSAHTKRTAKRYLMIAFFAGLTMTVCIFLRALLRGQSILDYFALPVLVYKIFFLPGIWLLSYFFPSKRKRLLKERHRNPNASP